MNNKDQHMTWDSALYQDKHAFVAEYGKDLLEYIPADPHQRILDLGCGTGGLSAALALKAGEVIGIDASPDMITMAQHNHPDLEFHAMDACTMPWSASFDIVFSNAVFHWIKDHEKLLASIHRALKPGGRLICEMGAIGNIASIEEAFTHAVESLGFSYCSQFFFPGETAYHDLLEQVGFSIEFIHEFDRPTPFEDGWLGMENWIRQFFARDLECLSASETDVLIRAMEADLKPKLWDGSRWVGDYRRLRFIAKVPEQRRE